MGAKAAVAGSKRRHARAASLACLFTAQVLALVVLANCGDGEVAMAMRDALQAARP